MTISELLAGLATKLGALGVATKVALGLGLATAGAATVGAAGALPAPAQHAVATAVNATPLHIPDPTDDHNATSTVDDVGGTVAPVVGDTTATGSTGRYTVGTQVMRWDNGDWRLYLPAGQAAPARAATDLTGFVTWNGVK